MCYEYCTKIPFAPSYIKSKNVKKNKSDLFLV